MTYIKNSRRKTASKQSKQSKQSTQTKKSKQSKQSKKSTQTKKLRFINNKTLKSFSPSINRRLITYKRGTKLNHLCIANKQRGTIKTTIKNYIKNPTIRLENGKCVKWDTDDAKKIMLKNLAMVKTIDPDNIIAPKQYASNCWFNCGFMVYYISDKGRKFMRYLREYMISGMLPKTDRSSFTDMPSNLTKPFFLFNLAIESSLQGDELAYHINTNSIIKEIYDNIPDKIIDDNMSGIVDVGKAGNPTSWHATIINYLQQNNSSIGNLYEYIYPVISNDDWEELKRIFSYNKHKYPELIIVKIPDDKKKPGSSGIVEKPLTLSFYNTYELAEYKLDSILIRTTDTRHFGCVITLNNRDYAFDGESNNRLEKFEWKSKINNDETWHLRGQSSSKWNFKNGYQELRYYRHK